MKTFDQFVESQVNRGIIESFATRVENAGIDPIDALRDITNQLVENAPEDQKIDYVVMQDHLMEALTDTIGTMAGHFANGLKNIHQAYKNVTSTWQPRQTVANQQPQAVRPNQPAKPAAAVKPAQTNWLTTLNQVMADPQFPVSMKNDFTNLLNNWQSQQPKAPATPPVPNPNDPANQ